MSGRQVADDEGEVLWELELPAGGTAEAIYHPLAATPVASLTINHATADLQYVADREDALRVARQWHRALVEPEGEA